MNVGKEDDEALLALFRERVVPLRALAKRAVFKLFEAEREIPNESARGPVFFLGELVKRQGVERFRRLREVVAPLL